MKIKTSELSDMRLNWVVTKLEAERQLFTIYPVFIGKYSTDWAKGGPIIEREKICLKTHTAWPYWLAFIEGNNLAQGPTPLVAAMRCYVASKLGNEVEVPDELTNQERSEA